MVSDGASVAPCCIVHGYRRAFAFGYRIVLKSMGMFPHCPGHEFQSDSKLGAWAVFLDSLVTVIVYAFAILNAYHLA